MVQIVENWAEIEGIVTRVSERDGMPEVEIEVNAARDVPGYPNLIAEDVGRLIAVVLRGDAAAARPEAGDRVRCRVRKAAPDRFYAQSLAAAPG